MINSRIKCLSLNLWLWYIDTNLPYRLEDLWLNDNQIPSLDGIEAALAGSREKLTTIYLERNPCVSISRLLYLFFESSYKSERKPRCDHDLNISSVTYDLIIILIVASIFLMKVAVIVPYFLYYVQFFAKSIFLVHVIKMSTALFF